jgi:hypothetical protein
MSQRLALLTVRTGEREVSMPGRDAVVHIIDDDAAVRESLERDDFRFEHILRW